MASTAARCTIAVAGFTEGSDPEVALSFHHIYTTFIGYGARVDGTRSVAGDSFGAEDSQRNDCAG